MRKYLPTLGELIDRLTIVLLKEVKIPKHKKEYEKSIQKKIDSILILSELSPNKARLKLQKLKEGIPTENYLYQNIIKQINYLK